MDQKKTGRFIAERRLYSFRYRMIRDRMSLIITFAGILGTAASLIAFIVRTW